MTEHQHERDMEYLDGLVRRLSTEEMHKVLKIHERMIKRHKSVGWTEKELELYWESHGMLPPNYRGCYMGKEFNIKKEKTDE